MITVTSVEAQERFRELLENVDEGPVAITREGQTAAFVVSPQDMEELLDARKRREAAESYLAWSAEAARRAAPETAALTDEEVNRLVHELR